MEYMGADGGEPESSCTNSINGMNYTCSKATNSTQDKSDSSWVDEAVTPFTNLMQKQMDYIDTALIDTPETEQSKRKPPYLPPCRICDGPASGFHYGVNTCEACKGFFRRSLARKIPYVCDAQGRCQILLTDRNSCPACRYDKCKTAGMSKEAIKTGRYTHAKRTLDTHEIKGKSYGVRNYQPCWSKNVKEEMMISITNAFRSTFHDSCFLYEHTEEIQALVRSILEKRKINRLDRIIQCKNVNLDGSIDLTTDNHTPKPANILTSIPLLNPTLSGDMLLAHEVESTMTISKQLFEVWTDSLNKFVKDLVAFVKKLPSFLELALTDQIVLIKSARTEITALIRHKHFELMSGTCTDYQSKSGSLIIIPMKLMTLLLLGSDGERSPLHAFFLQSVTRMNKLNLQVSWLALIVSLALFSPDRDGLSEEAQIIVARTQLQIVSVLEYTLKKHDPQDHLILPKLLMLLVDQRTNTELVLKALLNCSKGAATTLPPLFKELWPEHYPVDDTDQAFEHNTTKDNSRDANEANCGCLDLSTGGAGSSRPK